MVRHEAPKAEGSAGGVRRSSASFFARGAGAARWPPGSGTATAVCHAAAPHVAFVGAPPAVRPPPPLLRPRRVARR